MGGKTSRPPSTWALVSPSNDGNGPCLHPRAPERSKVTELKGPQVSHLDVQEHHHHVRPPDTSPQGCSRRREEAEGGMGLNRRAERSSPPSSSASGAQLAVPFFSFFWPHGMRDLSSPK